MGMRAAHECRLQHTGKAQVIYEAARASEQRPILDPLDRLANVWSPRHHYDCSHCSKRRCTRALLSAHQR
jgi:hypothetical protein